MADEQIKVTLTGDAAPLENSVKRADAALGKFKKSTLDANNALTSMNRVVQDAPFGFVAISNNITAAQESLGQLSKQAKEAGVSLGSVLLKSLSGPAGIGVAISLVTTAITFATAGFGAWTRGLSGADDKTKEVSQDLALMNDHLEDSKKRVEALTSAFDQMNRLGSINVEIAGLGKVTDLRAQADAAGRLADEVAQENIIREKEAAQASTRAIELGTEEAKKAYDDSLTALREGQKREADERGKQAVIYRQIELQKLNDQKDADEKTKAQRDKALAALRKHNAEMLAERERFMKENKTSEIESSGLFQDKGLKQSEIKFNKTQLEPIEAEMPVNIVAGDVEADINAILKALKLEELKRDLNDAVFKASQQIGATMFTSIGEGIGTAIAGGDLSSVFQSMFESLGGILQSLGTQIIALSPLITAIKVAIKTFSPVGILAAGVGLVALGTVVKTAFKSSAAHLATGGIVPNGFNGDTFPAMLSSREAVIPLDRLHEFMNTSGGSQVVVMNPRLRGRDLILQQSRESKSQRRGG